MDGDERRELEQSFSFLKEAGIELRSTEVGFDVYVSYKEQTDGPVQSRAVAKAVRQGDGWDISVAAVSVFWGPDWEEHPDLIGCDSLDGVMQFLFEALQPRLDLAGVLEGWRPRGAFP